MLVLILLVGSNLLRVLHHAVSITEGKLQLKLVLCKPISGDEFLLLLLELNGVLLLKDLLKFLVDG